jgi:hypothetical protein
MESVNLDAEEEEIPWSRAQDQLLKLEPRGGALIRIAQSFAARGWPLEVEGEVVTASFWAPTAPPPPWHLHRFRPTTALGVATASTGGATRWRFTPVG